jgi:biopolymer transport protein ExbB
MLNPNLPTVLEFLMKGGVIMLPLLGLSILTLACGLERSWFWYRLLKQEDEVVHQVLSAARHDLKKALTIAERSQDLPIGRFLSAPLELDHPIPETFRLAMEAAGDREFAQMRKGDQLLETVVAMAPLLGLLGTVTGLILTFSNLNIGSGGSAEDTSAAAAGIGEALITTAAGMVVAIVALGIFRVSTTFQLNQMDYFSDVGNKLDLIYRQFWYEPHQRRAERFDNAI